MDAGNLFKVLPVLGILSSGVQCFQWTYSSPEDGETVYACVGGSVSLPWDVTLSTGEEVVEVEWFYEGRSKELVAMSGHAGNFMVMPAYSGRVQHLSTAGLYLTHLTAGDAGMYVVEVSVVNGIAFNKHRRTASVESIEGPIMNGQLRIDSDPMAVYNSTTEAWHAVLQCGTFISLGQPPVQIEWTTPYGAAVPSSGYEGGKFILQLTNPTVGGTYTCHVTPDSPATRCQHFDRATLLLDKTKADVTVLRAENEFLKTAISQIDDGDESCVIVDNHGSSQQPVAFLADYGIENATQGGRISFHRELVDAGNGFDPGTGIFTVPVSGYYHFQLLLFVDNATVADDLLEVTTVKGPIITRSVTLYQTVDHVRDWGMLYNAQYYLETGDEIWVRGGPGSANVQQISFYAGMLLGVK